MRRELLTKNGKEAKPPKIQPVPTLRERPCGGYERGAIILGGTFFGSFLMPVPIFQSGL